MTVRKTRLIVRVIDEDHERVLSLLHKYQGFLDTNKCSRAISLEDVSLAKRMAMPEDFLKELARLYDLLGKKYLPHPNDTKLDDYFDSKKRSKNTIVN